MRIETQDGAEDGGRENVTGLPPVELKERLISDLAAVVLDDLAILDPWPRGQCRPSLAIGFMDRDLAEGELELVDADGGEAAQRVPANRLEGGAGDGELPVVSSFGDPALCGATIPC